MLTIYLATDHAGFALKNEVSVWLTEQGYEVVDCGAQTLDPEDDFPDFVSRAAQAVSEVPESRRAIVFGGSGQGEAMLANRYAGVRAAVYYGGAPDILTLSREHNDANVLSVGARFVGASELLPLLSTWLTTAALNEEKYARRNQKIEDITASFR